MLKYKPSIDKNNKIKENFVSSLNSLIYKAEKGKIHPHLHQEDINPILVSLKDSSEKLKNSLGTGEENIYDISLHAVTALKVLEKKLNQELCSQVETAADDLIYIMDCWEDVNNGKIEFNPEEFKNAQCKARKKKLLSRLDELDDLRDQFVQSEERLEKEIVALEKNEAELDDLILKEDNERRINEIYRKVTTLKSKKDTLNTRRSNYSACFNMLDLIHVNAKEIIAASDYSNIDLSKAKAFLNIGRLRVVLTEPDKALSILRRMEKDIKEIADRTKQIDTKVLNLNMDTTNVSNEALAYKENLMRKTKEKESLQDLDNDVEKTSVKENKIKGDK